MNRTLLTLILALGGLFASPAVARVHVVATLPSLGALARDVGGPDIDVDVLSSSTEDPHYVDPRPSLIVALNRADLLIINGLELEAGWLQKLQVQARNARIAPGGPGVLDASTVVDRLDVPQGKIDRAMGDLHPGGNPHFLFDPRAGQKIARSIAERIASLDPTLAPAVSARADKVVRELDEVATAIRARVDALPQEQRRVVVYHRSLIYVSTWLGLEQVATVEPKPGIPPDPGHVAAVLKTMKRTGTRTIIQEEFYPRNTSKTLAQLTGAKLAVLPGGARFSQGETFVHHMQTVGEEVLRGLSP